MANNSLWLIRSDDVEMHGRVSLHNGNEFIEIKPDKMPIAYVKMKMRTYIMYFAVCFPMLAWVTRSFSQTAVLLKTLEITHEELRLQYIPSEKNPIRLEYSEPGQPGISVLPTGSADDNLVFRLLDLSPATVYDVMILSAEGGDTNLLSAGRFMTKSKSTGQIRVYFNNTVDNTASSVADAIWIPAMKDTIIAYISQAQNTLDICNYNTGSPEIVAAVNTAYLNGVQIRYIAAATGLTNNDNLDDLDAGIPLIQRPDDGEVMHNKFIIADAGSINVSYVITGSVNHTENSLTQDYNNLVIIQDQSLALAYKLEFEEMWGSSGSQPDPGQAKFGNQKSDNTPHDFNIGGVPVELYFSPSDGTTAQIVSEIDQADNDLSFAMLTFINNDLGDAVIGAKNRGVNVRGIIENIYYIGSEYNGLLDAGVDVLSHFDQPFYMHHKYAVIDAQAPGSAPVVVTGSHNWTNSAEEDYDENTLIIHDEVIANMYFEEFTARYEEQTSVKKTGEQNGIIGIFPNPANDYFRIELRSGIEDVTGVEVSSPDGRVLKRIPIAVQRGSVKCFSGDLHPGLYFLSVFSPLESVSDQGKIVVIR
ncbi:MAG: phospholipase [Bacteroidetes bacterium]|nr:phospholipase [Bacteroidota bacterium]